MQCEYYQGGSESAMANPVAAAAADAVANLRLITCSLKYCAVCSKNKVIFTVTKAYKSHKINA